MHPSLIGLGFLLMFISSYVDNIRGPLLPVISQELHLNYAQAGSFLSYAYCGAVGISFLLILLMRRFSDRKLTLAVLIISMLTCLGAQFVSGIPSLFIFAFFLGFTIASTGTLANVMVMHGTDSERRSRYFGGLHMMYGIGSLSAPLFVLLFGTMTKSWKFPFLPMAAILLFLPLMIRVVSNEKTPPPVDKREGRLKPIHYFAMGIFAFYVIGEVMTTMWLVTYLYEGKKFSLSTSSAYLSGFFVFMALTRGLTFLFLKPKIEKKLILVCLSVSTILFFVGISKYSAAFILAGVLGPCFPVFLARLGRVFPSQARLITVSILAVDQLSLIFGHQMMGRMAEAWGIVWAFHVPGFFLAATVFLLGIYFWLEPQQSLASNG